MVGGIHPLVVCQWLGVRPMTVQQSLYDVRLWTSHQMYAQVAPQVATLAVQYAQQAQTQVCAVS